MCAEGSGWGWFWKEREKEKEVLNNGISLQRFWYLMCNLMYLDSISSKLDLWKLGEMGSGTNKSVRW